MPWDVQITCGQSWLILALVFPFAFVVSQRQGVDLTVHLGVQGRPLIVIG